jgi:hypothetical protein
MRLLVALLCASLVSTNAAAQSTRVAAIAEEQAEKAKTLGAEGPSDAERVIRRILLSPLLSGGDGAYPWFGSVFAGTGMAIGAGYRKRLENAAYFDVQTAISLNNSMLVRGTFATPELWRGRLQAKTTAEWMDARGVSFYGSGQDSALAARERYDYSPKELGGTVAFKPVRFVSVTGGYSLLNFTTHRDLPHFSESDAPGLDRALTYHVARGTVAYDWRPASGYSTRGGFYRASWERNQENNGQPYSFNTQEYEIVQLVPLVREQFVLAARGLMTLSNTDAGNEVPVILEPFLGSGSALRGFANRRFTDRNRLLLTGEYRWRPSRYLDMALFLDAGQVTTDRSQFDLGALEMVWGIGARFHGPTFNAFRIDIARGREGLRLVFAGSQPF